MKRMGILGPRGTHSEAAACYLNGVLETPCEMVEYGEIFEALAAVSEGEVETALVPVENSLEGAVNITLDMLARSDDLQVLRELIWPVHNQLMAKPGVRLSGGSFPTRSPFPNAGPICGSIARRRSW